MAGKGFFRYEVGHVARKEYYAKPLNFKEPFIMVSYFRKTRINIVVS